MEIKVRPSVSEVKVFCEGCDSSTNFYLTNQEIKEDNQIMAICKKCKKFTNWNIKRVYL